MVDGHLLEWPYHPFPAFPSHLTSFLELGILVKLALLVLETYLELDPPLAMTASLVMEILLMTLIEMLLMTTMDILPTKRVPLMAKTSLHMARMRYVIRYKYLAAAFRSLMADGIMGLFDNIALIFCYAFDK